MVYGYGILVTECLLRNACYAPPHNKLRFSMNYLPHDFEALSATLRNLYTLPIETDFCEHVLNCVTQLVACDWAAYYAVTDDELPTILAMQVQKSPGRSLPLPYLAVIQRSLSSYLSPDVANAYDPILPQSMGPGLPGRLMVARSATIHGQSSMVVLGRLDRAFTAINATSLTDLRHHLWQAERNWHFFEQSQILPASSPADFETLGLTRRQAEVMSWVVQGQTNQVVADRIGCSDKTVKKHLEHIYQRFGVRNKAAAVAFALGSDRGNAPRPMAFK
jgi:DNA-binding CsgD family transcriptional regulator